jgi:hypothetical protein
MRVDGSALKLATTTCFTVMNGEHVRDGQLQVEIHNLMYVMHEDLWDCMNRIITITKRERLHKPIHCMLSVFHTGCQFLGSLFQIELMS